MKRLLIFCLFPLCSVLANCAQAQTVDATVCGILANPSSFDGKMVRIKGAVVAGFDEFAITDSSCNQPINAIWLAYPEGTKAKSGPVAFVQIQLGKNNPVSAPSANRAPVKLDKNNKDFKQFDALLSTPPKSGGMCLGCVRYAVTATLVGRLDGTKEAGLARDVSGKIIGASGFGNLNQYAARLVLQSVSDVSSQEIDFSKAAAAARSDAQSGDAGGDPVAAAHQAARALGPAGAQVERAAAAFGKEGEDNGVQIDFGIPNELPKNDNAKGDRNSPDGLLFNCVFDVDHLKGSALSVAIAHIGAHIADTREPQSAGMNPYEVESRAWQVTILSAVGNRQSTLTLPGGSLGWNSAWPNEDRTKMVNDAVNKFLTGWAGYKNPG
jgi:hypothetical protein